MPGCDLRLPGTNLPPVVCLIARQPDGVRLRKLAPTLPILAAMHRERGPRAPLTAMRLAEAWAAFERALPADPTLGGLPAACDTASAGLSQFEKQLDGLDRDFQQFRRGVLPPTIPLK